MAFCGKKFLSQSAPIRAIRGSLLLMISTSLAHADFDTDLAALTQYPHRLTGTAEGAEAYGHVLTRLKSMGLDDVIMQPFATAGEEILECELSWKGASLELLPMRPNNLMHPVTPTDGITAELVHAGLGTLEEFSNLDLSGKIALLHYNAGQRWRQAIRYGAKAVLFYGSGDLRSDRFHYLEVPANIPRFFTDAPLENLPVGSTVTVKSSIVWEAAEGMNIIGFLKGTNPTFQLGQEETVLLTADFDSFGEVPRRSPGARKAANVAGLLELADYFSQNRPRRNLAFVFFDGNSRAHSGSRAFYRAQETRERDHTVFKREDSWKAEWAFNQSMQDLVTSPNPLHAKATGYRREFLELVKRQALQHDAGVRYEMTELRKGIAEARDMSNTDLEAQRTQALADLKPVKELWSTVRRQLGRNEIPNPVGDTLSGLVNEVRSNVKLRHKELVREDSLISADKQVFNLLNKQAVIAHIVMNFGDSRDRWGMVIGADTPFHGGRDYPGIYGKLQEALLRSSQQLADSGQPLTHFETATVDGSLPKTRTLMSMPILTHSGEIAGRFGIFNFCFATSQERMTREGSPDDTLENLNVAVMQTQFLELRQLLNTALGLEDLSILSTIERELQFQTKEFDGKKVKGALAMGRTRGSSQADQPMAGIPVSVNPFGNRSPAYRVQKAYGYDDYPVMITDQNGAYDIGMMNDWTDFILLGFAARFDDRGQLDMATDLDSRETTLYRLNLMEVRDGYAMLPPTQSPEKINKDAIKLLDARANSVISNSGSTRSFFNTADGISYWFADLRIKNLKLFSLPGNIVLMNDKQSDRGLQENVSYGTGFSSDNASTLATDPLRSGGDIWRLNESRLQVLRDRNVANSSLEELHSRSADLLEEAEDEASVIRREALGVSSMMSSIPVYESVLKSMDDLVNAVLVLLALCVPFAFALERLLIGSPSIYKQVGWFTAFFSMAFLLIYFTHPAFAIAKTPAIIFLGFTVVVLSAIVIFILMQKFEQELKAMQGMTASVHSNDISRFNTILASVNMGISTMRRRPLRTTLTAVTIILLTFTILAFASFDTQKGIIRLFSAPTPAYSGAQVHDPSWGDLNEEILQVVESRWRDSSDIFGRYWIHPTSKDDPGLILSHAQSHAITSIAGVVGLEPHEMPHRSDLQSLLGSETFGEEQIFMTQALADSLDLDNGDTVLLGGISLTVGGIISGAQASIARDMDGSSILPVDFVQLQESASSAPPSGAQLEQQTQFASLPADDVVFVSADVARRLGAKFKSFSLYTPSVVEASELAEDLARMMDLPVAATRVDGVYRHRLGTKLAASGFADLIFPVFLGGLVIFGTMLGSVADREKEIYTFSALGLAPPHVASLFFAEASVYSVIGGLSGYLIAQVSMKIMTIMAEFGWVAVPDMNYSSSNAIITILIVMATVMISALYPAYKASKSANPGLLRSWSPGMPEGDEFDIRFPFTVSQYDITGVVSFLQEHFDSFSDAGLGCFMSQKTRLVKEDDGQLGLDAVVALAPFDLGVTQGFALRSRPSEIDGIDEIMIRLERRSGQPKDWIRQNKIFLNDLRQQFLLWRSIPNDTMEAYRSRTLTHFGKGGEG